MLTVIFVNNCDMTRTIVYFILSVSFLLQSYTWTLAKENTGYGSNASWNWLILISVVKPEPNNCEQDYQTTDHHINQKFHAQGGNRRERRLWKVIPFFEVVIWLEYRSNNVNPKNNQPTIADLGRLSPSTYSLTLFHKSYDLVILHSMNGKKTCDKISYVSGCLLYIYLKMRVNEIHYMWDSKC